ncbi:MAG: MBL fold metallo-hydrolase [Rhodospirillales bacterium]|nr:MBL fold metallo-hydrolase [Rhodospirillales bacterium]
MNAPAKLTILGSGNSAGVPALFNHWGACDSNEPKNRRRRACAVFQVEEKILVVDTGPDFRDQFNQAGWTRIDAVLYTHYHGDHVHGIDELRYVARTGGRLDVYGNASTLDNLQTRFSYLFAGSPDGLYQSILKPHMIMDNQYGKPMTIGGIPCTPFEQDHGTCVSTGLRVGDVAYSVDLVNLDAAGIAALRGVKTWVVDGGAYHHENPLVHAGLPRLYDLNEKIGAETVVIVNLSAKMDYQTLRRELRPGFEPGYDGMEIPVTI